MHCIGYEIHLKVYFKKSDINVTFRKYKCFDLITEPNLFLFFTKF